LNFDSSVSARKGNAMASKSIVARDVQIFLPNGTVKGEMTVPSEPRGSVVIGHCATENRLSPESRGTALRLHARGFATLVADLLPEGPDRDVLDRAASTLTLIVDWLRADSEVGRLPLGLYSYGSEDGGAACLVVAAGKPGEIGAIAIRGGRPDRAGHALGLPLPPTLLIVGADDVSLLRQNKDAFRRLQASHRHLEFVEGASNGFREPGKFEEATLLAADWFTDFLVARPSERIAMR